MSQGPVPLFGFACVAPCTSNTGQQGKENNTEVFIIAEMILAVAYLLSYGPIAQVCDTNENINA